MTQAALVTLKQTEARWVHAHHPVNADVIAEILDDAYQHIDNERLCNKRDTVASYRSGERYWQQATASAYTFTLCGNLGVVTGIWHGTGVNAGVYFDYHARFVSIYIKRDTGWKLYRDESVPFKETA